WSSQPDPNREIAGDRRKPAPSLRRYRRARSLAALLRPATPLPGARPDFLRGSTIDELFLARKGDDSVMANNGNDIAYGGRGNDTLVGQSGNDVLYGGGSGPSFARLDRLSIDKDYKGTITFEGETAGYLNTIGSYKVVDGKISDVQIVWSNASLPGSGGNIAAGTSQSLELRGGDQLGFFVVSNGASQNDFSKFVNGRYEFRDAMGQAATLESTNPQLWFVSADGKATQVRGDGYHSAAYGKTLPLNNDGILHTVGRVDADAGTVRIGFEDLKGGGDRDFDDAVITVNIGKANVQVLTAHGRTGQAGEIVDGVFVPAAPKPYVEGTEDDILQGGEGNDTLYGRSGNDRLYGDNGNDTIRGGTGNDIAYGGTGDDKVYGEAGNDTLHGDSGNDTIDGGAGNDIAYGGSGNDTLVGGDGADWLAGESGYDILSGGADDDVLDAGAGDDSLDGGTGADTLLGDSGNDKLVGGAGNDKLAGGTGNDSLDGGSENDVLSGGEGTDTLSGGSGDDMLSGDAGNDTLDGGSGNDVLSGGEGTDKLLGGTGDDQLSGDAGNDTLDGGSGNDALAGGAGTDKLSGGSGDDKLSGDADNDTLDGGVGNDSLDGGAGNDRLIGGSGDDSLYGGSGSDVLTGGLGRDTFVFRALDAKSGVDTIKDFEIGLDRIDVSDFFGGSEAGKYADGFHVGFDLRDDGLHVTIDADGVAGSGAAMEIAMIVGTHDQLSKIGLDSFIL
ncbi:MAG: DUF4114 domain-containing protein, partial [Rhodospirillales bacterium]|nr:DUF4114 domain-containing protein [Rhodospirillales bacterium]